MRHDGERSVGEPDARDDQGQGRSSRERALQQGAGRRATAKLEEQNEGNPEAAGELRVIAAHIDVDQHVAEEDGSASSQGGRPVGKQLPGKCSSGKPGGREQKIDEHNRDHRPRKEQAQKRAGHPGQRRVEDKARLACSEVWSVGPVRIEDPVQEAALRLDPGDEVEGKVSATGRASLDERPDRQRSGSQDHGRSYEPPERLGLLLSCWAGLSFSAHRRRG